MVRLRRALTVAALVCLTTAGLLALSGGLDAGAQGNSATTASTAPSSSPPTTAGSAPQDAAQVKAGEQLYLTGCVSCHGVGGVGTTRGPSLARAGAARADFMLRTGRMPLANPTGQAPQKPPAYTDAEIKALVAYVASIGVGPPIPDVQPQKGDLSLGSQLYLANCAACHNSSGIGGALSYGNHAPALLTVAPTQIGEAIRTGPGQMPVFGPTTFSDAQVDSIVRYVGYLQNPDHRGGLPLGSAGPVPEGFVAWMVGIGILLLFARWITREHG